MDKLGTILDLPLLFVPRNAGRAAWALLAALVAALLISGCSLIQEDGPSGAGTQSITVYDAELLRDDAGEVVRGEDGQPVVRMTQPREMTERSFVLHMQERAIQRCANLQGEEQSANADPSRVDSAAGDEGYWDWRSRRDLIIALKPDFDPTGCTAIVKAQESYWRAITAELQLMSQKSANRSRWVLAALKMAGFYLITDNITDAMVGVAQASGSNWNIGNRYVGDVKGAGKGPGGSTVTQSASGDTTLGDDWIITTGNKSPVQTGDGELLSGSDAQLQEGDGVLGQVITRPANAQPDSSLDLQSEGAEASGAF